MNCRVTFGNVALTCPGASQETNVKDVVVAEELPTSLADVDFT